MHHAYRVSKEAPPEITVPQLALDWQDEKNETPLPERMGDKVRSGQGRGRGWLGDWGVDGGGGGGAVYFRKYFKDNFCHGFNSCALARPI